MKDQPARRRILKLHRETLRQLSGVELAHAAGGEDNDVAKGGGSAYSCEFPTYCRECRDLSTITGSVEHCCA